MTKSLVTAISSKLEIVWLVVTEVFGAPEGDSHWHLLSPDSTCAVASLVHVDGQARNVVNQS